LIPTNLSPNLTLAFKCGVIPCEKKQIQAPLVFLSTWWTPSSLVDLLLLEPCS
jgi:hypothetical protein